MITLCYIDYEVWHNNCQLRVKNRYLPIVIMPCSSSGEMESGEVLIKEGRVAEDGCPEEGLLSDILCY